MKNKIFSFKTVRGKLLFYFLLVVVLLLIINVYTFYNSQKILKHIDLMFNNSVKLFEINENIEQIDFHLNKYLISKSNNDLKLINKNINILRSRISKINRNPTYNLIDLKWKNLVYIIDEYIIYVEAAIKAKKDKKVVAYYSNFNETQKIFEYIKDLSNSINNIYLEDNINFYKVIENRFKKVQIINFIAIICIVLGSLIIVMWSSNVITKPIILLAEKARKISAGDFNIEDVRVISEDEIQETAKAFNEMKNSILKYIEELKEKSEIEIKLAEQEMQNLKMKNLVKNAKLEMLQAQMNPHFLFNTINACIQMAQVENANKTAQFLYNMSKLLRYNLKNINSIVTLKEEIENVDSYIYLLKMRYEDILKYEKDIDEKYLDKRVPLLILQPIVENAFIHGISEEKTGGVIKLTVKGNEDMVDIIIEDNGKGMNKETINKILNFDPLKEDIEVSKKNKGNGIGLKNVIQRLELYFERKSLFIESEIGKGTKFIIKIPVNSIDKNIYD